MNIITRIALYGIKFYRNCLKDIFLSCCKFHPSCSEYAEVCFKKRGFLRAIPLIFWRILRCNPFSAGGWDTVEEKSDT